MSWLPNFKPFQNALDKINKFFAKKYWDNLDSTERDFYENVNIVPARVKDYIDINSDTAYLKLIFTLGQDLKNLKEDVIKLKIQENEDKFDEKFLEKFIIINYYCYKLSEKRISLIQKKLIQKKDRTIDGRDLDNILSVKNFLKLIFHHYCNKYKIENVNRQFNEIGQINEISENTRYKIHDSNNNYFIKQEFINYQNNSPKNIFDHIKHYPKMVPIERISDTTGSIDQVNGKDLYDGEKNNKIYEKIENGGRTRRRQKRKSKRKSTKRRTKRKLRRKNTKK